MDDGRIDRWRLAYPALVQMALAAEMGGGLGAAFGVESVLSADLFSEQQSALLLVNRLRQLRVEPRSLSATDVREAILAAGMEIIVYGRPTHGKGVWTFEDAFAHAFGEPLVPKPQKKRRGKESRIST